MAERMLTTRELADWLGVPPKTVHTWRSAGTGPAGHKVGRHVRYAEADVRAWLEARRDEPSRNGNRPGRG